MHETIHSLIQALVDYPEEVQVKRVEGERSLILEVRVRPEDVGHVIGRSGRTANALRALARAAGTKIGKNVWIDINRLPEEEAEQEPPALI